MNKTTLLELAGRVEKAGNDREMFACDCEIERLLFDREQGMIRRFSTSLDEAMELVPEGCAPYLDWGHYATDPSGMIFYEAAVQRISDGHTLGHAEAATPALALTAAALRALAEQSNG